MKTPREVLFERHRMVEPKLDQVWSRIAARPSAAPYQLLWRELIWPCRRIWAGLACAWVVIAALNLASPEPGPRVVTKAELRSHEEMQALAEQRRLLAQLIEPATPAESKRKSVATSPRSDRPVEVSSA